MAAAGLSLLNVFVLGLVQRKRERAVLRAIGSRPRQEQAVVIAHAVLLGALAAVFGGLGGIGLSYLWALGSPVQYGIKIGWDVLVLPLRTGAAAVYPVVQARRLESAEVLRGA
jgi:putative ABC transport system permease protein